MHTMNRILILVFLVLSCIGSYAQDLKNEVALVIAPLDFEESSSYQMMYRRDLSGLDDIQFRGGLRLVVDTDKETRSDTLAYNRGSVVYDLSVGLQKDLGIGDLEKVFLYTGSDAYFNSELRRELHETFYGYYWNFGLRPIVGISYTPFENIRVSLESRADFNVNLQSYSAEGVNEDARVSFMAFKEVGLALGYLF